jgi:S-disulfanyl-L-cysteine oxidoreductase SoxD
MFSRSLFATVGCITVLAVAAADGRRYNIGHVASPEEIGAAGISVAPDGAGLPTGSGNAIQGRLVYQTHWAACHGIKGEGNAAYPALVGGLGTLKSNEPVLTVGSYWPYATTVWDYINRAMPYTDAGSLTPKQVYSVTAYILYMNGIVGERDELNKMNLAKVRMPNRNGFTSDPRPDVP